jgi:GTP-binding protein
MKILSASFLTSAKSFATCPASDLPEFALIGRSNVGKSSLLNMLVERKALANVSGTPGHTRLINFFTVNNTWTLVDLPGYGYAKTIRDDRRQFEDIITDYTCQRNNLLRLFVLIDSRHPPQKIDVEFITWALNRQLPLALVFTKTDKLKPAAVQKNIALFRENLPAGGEEIPLVFKTSSETRDGRKELLAYIEAALEEDADDAPFA